MANYFKGTADNASTLNGQNASYYLDYNNLTNKPSLNFLPLTGGTLTGSLIMDALSVQINIPQTRSWARGLSFQNNGIVVGMAGMYGNNTTINNMFFGLGSDPWNGVNTLTVTESDVKFNNVSLARSNGTYSDMTVGKATTATTATTATKTQASLTFTGAVTGTWNGSAAKTVNIPAATTLASLGITATAAELNKLDGCTATTAELNFVDGVTSNIQTQLNGKASSSHTHSYLPLTGGTLTGSLIMDALSVQINIPQTRSWARGLSFQNNGIVVGMAGMYGNNTTINNMFFGLGSDPWNGVNTLTVTESDVKFNNVSLARSNGTYSNMTVGKATTATTATTATNSNQLGGVAAANFINTSDTVILKGVV